MVQGISATHVALFTLALHLFHQCQGASSQGRCSDIHGHPHRMECGPGVPLCGILVLETGRGSRAYRHGEPVVHGLWPELGHYGDSKCVSPRQSGEPDRLHECYDQPGEPRSHSLSFQRHEWQQHGVCAGAADADDFFQQVCSLSARPLRVMAGARAAGLDLVDTADQLQRSGVCVWSTDHSHKQIALSACAGADGRWKLADVNDFGRVCGSAMAPARQQQSPVGQQQPALEQPAVCVPNRHGPRCKSDADCGGVAGCVRCANSGYCTTVPLRQKRSEQQTTTKACVPNRHGPPCASDEDCDGVSGCARCAKSGYCTNIPLTLFSARAEGRPDLEAAAAARWAGASQALHVHLPRIAMLCLLVSLAVIAGGVFAFNRGVCSSQARQYMPSVASGHTDKCDGTT